MILKETVPKSKVMSNITDPLKSHSPLEFVAAGWVGCQADLCFHNLEPVAKYSAAAVLVLLLQTELPSPRFIQLLLRWQTIKVCTVSAPSLQLTPHRQPKV